MAEVADFLVFLSMTRDDAIKMINDRFGAEALEGSSLLYHEEPKYWAAGIYYSIHPEQF